MATTAYYTYCSYCMNPVEREHDICDECLSFDCPDCKDEPITAMGSDNMDIYFVRCTTCGRDGYDLGYHE